MNKSMSTSSPDPLLTVASILGRPVDKLQELDRRRLSFAFIEGHYEIFVVRDLTTGENLEVALALKSGRRINPVELSKRDRERATIDGGKLEPKLLELLLRHSDLKHIQVRLHFSLKPIQSPGVQEMNWCNSDLRQKFQSHLDTELSRLRVGVPISVSSGSPTIEVILSAPQIIKLSRSLLIQYIKLIADPEVLDE